MINKSTFTIIALLLAMLAISCQKDFLDKKPSTAIIKPTTLDEFQSLLDNFTVNNLTTGLGVISSDDHEFYNQASWSSTFTATERNAYIWTKDIYDGEVVDDWNKPYTAIFYANNILSELDKIDIVASERKRWGNIKGWALFVRAFAYYELVNNFAPYYDSGTASSDFGVPLRLDPSIDKLEPRATVRANYSQILADLSSALSLLADIIPTEKRNRPSKVAVHALLARIYLNMRNYDKADSHADSCLRLYDKLIDYNTLSKTSLAPFSIAHDELIYAKMGVARSSNQAANTYIKINPHLINLYTANDLRPIIYFTLQPDGSYRIKRGYNGTSVNPFVGLATDEVYLIRAETLARKGEILSSMILLNKLLVRRWDPSATTPARSFQPIEATTVQDALDKVLLERRKELVWRGLRWDDLKRLNKEGANIALTRSLNGNSYLLPPNNNRYVFPIPDDEISLSGIEQNLR